jgi:hypothetical protein
MKKKKKSFDTTWLELVMHMDIFGVSRKTTDNFLLPLFAKFKLGEEKVSKIQGKILKLRERPEVKSCIMGDSSA